MLLEGTSPDMMSAQSKLLFQINKYYNERVHARKANVNKTIREVCKVVQDVLKEVEVQEPRFIRWENIIVTELTQCQWWPQVESYWPEYNNHGLFYL